MENTSMRKYLILTVLLVSLIFSQTQVFSVEEEVKPSQEIEYALPYPGILPDHPLYFLKVWRDKALLFITKDTGKKIQLYVLIADKQLVMGRILLEKGKNDLAWKTFKQGELYLLTAASNLKKIDKLQTSNFIDKILLSTKKHQEILSRLSLSEDEANLFQEVLGINNQAIQQIQ